MKDTHLIGIVGMPGAGKSIAADFFRQKKFPVLRLGDQTDIGLKEAGLPRTEENERWYREKIRQELGMAAMAIKIVPRIIALSVHEQIVILDGLYSWEEYVYLHKQFPRLTLLCIYASPKVRYSRLAKRKERPLTYDSARSRDFAEIGQLNKGGPIALADYLIKNEGNKDIFMKNLEDFLNTL